MSAGGSSAKLVDGSRAVPATLTGNGLWLLLPPHSVDDDDDEPPPSVDVEEDVDIVGKRSLFAELGRVNAHPVSVFGIFSLFTEFGRDNTRPPGRYDVAVIESLLRNCNNS